MGSIRIIDSTPKSPITLSGEMIGPCYGSDTSDAAKNHRRGLNAMRDGHGRVFEYCDVWMVFDGYSAKVMRELYTHIGGAPTRTQASTRYIKYKSFDYVTPPKVAANDGARVIYENMMRSIAECTTKLQEQYGIPQEDANMVLPLGMTTTVSCRFNFRTLIAMYQQRSCNRAYWEFRELMRDMAKALSDYSPEWKELVDEFFKCKCDLAGYCLESRGCGKYPKKID